MQEHSYGFPDGIVDTAPENANRGFGAGETRRSLMRDINWSHTKEGGAFWADIHARLLRIHEKGR